MAPGDSRRLARSGLGMVSCSLSFACSACSDGRLKRWLLKRGSSSSSGRGSYMTTHGGGWGNWHTLERGMDGGIVVCKRSWLHLCVRSVALAVVEHERSRAQATGSSVLCGSILSCADGLEKRTQLRAARPRLQRLESDDEAGDGSEKPETMEQAIDGFDLKTFGGEATGTPPPDPFPPLTPSPPRFSTPFARPRPDREMETSPHATLLAGNLMKRVCCADYYEKPQYFGRFKIVGDQDDDTPVRPAPTFFDAIVGSDSYVPSTQHSQFLHPGMVAYDVPKVSIPPLAHHPLSLEPTSEAHLQSPLFRARSAVSPYRRLAASVVDNYAGLRLAEGVQ